MGTADMDNPDWLDMNSAMVCLGVARQTLYAYVSRGLLRSRPADDDMRRSLYDRHAIEALIARRRRGRGRQPVATSMIDWGEPMLTSRITRIEAGSLSYRGHDAIALSATATLEDAAALLWQTPSLPCVPPWRHPPRGATPMARCLAAAAQLAAPASFARGSRALVAEQPACCSGSRRLPPARAAPARRRPHSPPPGAPTSTRPIYCDAPWCCARTMS